MNGAQRKIFAEGLINLANIVAGALVFGQVVSGQYFSARAFFIGIVLTIVLYLGAYWFSKKSI